MAQFIVSLVLLLATLIGAVLIEGGNPLAFIGLSGIVIELLVPFFAMLAVWRFAEIGRAFGDSFAKKVSAKSRATSARVWAFTEKVCYATGVVAFILGGVLALSRIAGSLEELGRALAISLLAPLYGVLLGIFCRIMKARVER
jgi:flagellar motor component MotA